jgi:hypothetical protein
MAFSIDNRSFSYQSPLVAAVPAFAPGYAWATRLDVREAIIRFGINYRVGTFGM